jgi:hypothetical protein
MFWMVRKQSNMVRTRPENGRQQTAQTSAVVAATRKEDETKTDTDSSKYIWTEENKTKKRSY